MSRRTTGLTIVLKTIRGFCAGLNGRGRAFARGVRSNWKILIRPAAKRQSEAERRRNAFVMTVTELRLIAALAIIGFNRSPVNG